MGLSNYLPSSRIAQAGVIPDTANRPASPYEGQMLYQKDTNQVLVYDGSAWVMIADTDTPPGLELVKVQTIGSAVASVTVSGCFSSTYDNYRVTIQGVVNSEAANFTFQFSGITSSTYLTGGTFFNYANATVNGYGPAATTSWIPGPAGASNSHCVIDLFAPQATTTKSMFSQGGSTAAYYSFGGACTSTSSATGFVLGVNAGTMTGGTIRVYGYRNS